mmetsp:Transcript_33924/g.64836  ORF Transcript_33924/g.64836 Transcript_33924/m.64836 type:complete len:250 (+) Transcript_33924:212-961(+)
MFCNCRGHLTTVRGFGVASNCWLHDLRVALIWVLNLPHLLQNICTCRDLASQTISFPMEAYTSIIPHSQDLLHVHLPGRWMRRREALEGASGGRLMTLLDTIAGWYSKRNVFSGSTGFEAIKLLESRLRDVEGEKDVSGMSQSWSSHSLSSPYNFCSSTSSSFSQSSSYKSSSIPLSSGTFSRAEPNREGQAVSIEVEYPRLPPRPTLNSCSLDGTPPLYAPCESSSSIPHPPPRIEAPTLLSALLGRC